MTSFLNELKSSVDLWTSFLKVTFSFLIQFCETRKNVLLYITKRISGWPAIFNYPWVIKLHNHTCGSPAMFPLNTVETEQIRVEGRPTSLPEPGLGGQMLCSFQSMQESSETQFPGQCNGSANERLTHRLLWAHVKLHKHSTNTGCDYRHYLYSHLSVILCVFMNKELAADTKTEPDSQGEVQILLKNQ